MADPNSEDTRTQEQKRADRQAVAKKEQEFLRDVASGMTEEQLRAAGYGNRLINELVNASEFGPGVMFSGLNIDILNKQVYDPRYGYTNDKGEYVRGAWRPMSEYPGLYESIINYQAERDSPQGQGWANAYPNSYQGYLAKQRLDRDVAAGHLQQDPKTGYYFNAGKAAPGDYANFQWFDPYGRPASMPAGFSGGGAPGAGGYGGGFSTTGQPGAGGFGAGFGAPATVTGGGLQDVLLDTSLTNVLSKFYGWPEVPGSQGTRKLPTYAQFTPGGGLAWGDFNPGFGKGSGTFPAAAGPSLVDVVKNSGASKKLKTMSDWSPGFPLPPATPGPDPYSPPGGKPPHGPLEM